MKRGTFLFCILSTYNLFGTVQSWLSSTCAINDYKATMVNCPLYPSSDCQSYRRRSFSLLTMSSFSSAGEEKETSSATATAAKPIIGDIVTIKCALIPQFELNEQLFDGIGDEPSTLQFVLGAGNYIPGLHKLVGTMELGAILTDQTIDAGAGFSNPALIAEIKFDDSGIDKSQIKVGTQLYLSSGAKCRVTAVTDDTFTIDANPPMAGKSYLVKTIELVSTEPGPTPYEYTEVKPGNSKYEVATFALGCFWGGELEFMRVPGVVGTAVGYTQGHIIQPSYKQVCSGTTGHTEAILVYYDPTQVSYEQLCNIAMERLGPNKYLLNQVGNDRGTQYRHGIYYHNPEQKLIAERIMQADPKCVSECKPATVFYMAEDYHQQYLLKGGQSARKNDSTTIRCYG